VVVEPPQSHIVFVDVPRDRAVGLMDRLKAAGVLATGLYRLRFVTHLDVDAAGIDHAIAVLQKELG
jgi:threonine aldolase